MKIFISKNIGNVLGKAKIVVTFFALTIQIEFLINKNVCFGSAFTPALGLGALAAFSGVLGSDIADFLDAKARLDAATTPEETLASMQDMINALYRWIDCDCDINDISNISKDEINETISDIKIIIEWINGGEPPGNEVFARMFYRLPFKSNPYNTIIN